MGMVALLMAGGIVVSCLVCLKAVERVGRQQGAEEERRRLRRLWIRQRAAAEYELLTGVPLSEAMRAREFPRIAGGRTIE